MVHLRVDEGKLVRELDVLHRQFFHTAAPPGMVENYIKAHAEVTELSWAGEMELRTVNIIIEKGLDALGIEPWLRSGPRRHLLTRKLLLIAYLAECDGRHPGFRYEVRGWFRSISQLFSSASSACLHLLRGRLQKTYYGLL